MVSELWEPSGEAQSERGGGRTGGGWVGGGGEGGRKSFNRGRFVVAGKVTVIMRYIKIHALNKHSLLQYPT